MNLDAALGGRILVAPDAPAAPGEEGLATSRVARCARALRSAGHLVETAPDLDAAQRDVVRADHETLLVMVSEPERLRRRVDALKAAPLDYLPVIAVGVPVAEASRALILAGVDRVVADLEPMADIEAAVARSVRHARALRREARFDPLQRDLARQIGGGAAMTMVHDLVSRASQVDAPVLLIGEVGAGKRLVARAIHAASRLRTGPFVSWPVGAVAPEGVQRVREALFGTVAAPGAIEAAHGGTLLVDEIALLPDPIQPSLLDLLTLGGEPRATRADGSARYRADVRLIAGASTDLRRALDAGTMREDLYQRLRIFPIEIPPLRMRPEDIPMVVDSLLDLYARRFGRPVVALAPEAVALLQAHEWPGNIRELQEHIERAVKRSHGPALRDVDLAELSHRIGRRGVGRHSGTIDVRIALDDGLPLRDLGRRAAAAAEIVAIRAALKQTEGNVTNAARRLGVSRIHLQKRMKLYGLRDTNPGA